MFIKEIMYHEHMMAGTGDVGKAASVRFMILREKPRFSVLSVRTSFLYTSLYKLRVDARDSRAFCVILEQ